MAHNLYSRFKKNHCIVLLTVMLGITGCTFPRALSPHQKTLRALQKEKTSISRFRQYRRMAYPAYTQRFWDSLQNDFTLLHHTKQSSVKKQMAYFLKRPYQLRSTIQRSAPYMHYVYEQVKKRNLPGELVLLPFIESTYDPLATNTLSTAAGLWQLTTPTAQRFGIRQDAIFDGKHDLYASTNAALDYIAYLNQLFSGNWLLTLGAYMAGEGNVQKALRYNMSKNRSTSFWKLPLSDDTITYVAKLLALSAIIKKPQAYDLTLPVINKQPYLERVLVKRGISIVHAAALANISLQEMKRFNPGFKQLRFIPKQPYYVLLPTAHVTTFKKNIASASIQSMGLRVTYHTIKPNDRLSYIAKKYRVTVKQLCLWNGLKSNQKLPVGKNIMIVKMPLLGL